MRRYVQNNMLSGVVPRSLLNKNIVFKYIFYLCTFKNLYFVIGSIHFSKFPKRKEKIKLTFSSANSLFHLLNFSYSGNVYLRAEKNTKKDFVIIICSMVGVVFLLAALSCCCFLSRKRIKFFSKEGN